MIKLITELKRCQLLEESEEEEETREDKEEETTGSQRPDSEDLSRAERLTH